jgi:curved DNA-binding protein
MPDPADPTRRGDLFARVKVVLPTDLSERERALFEELRALRAGSEEGEAGGAEAPDV